MALPLRLLAERTGLRAGLSAAMTRRGFTPLYDRGQLLVDLAPTYAPTSIRSIQPALVTVSRS